MKNVGSSGNFVVSLGKKNAVEITNQCFLIISQTFIEPQMQDPMGDTIVEHHNGTEADLCFRVAACDNSTM